MTRTFKVEIKNNGAEAVVTKAYAKNAKIYGTDEYRHWREIVKEFPEIIMKTKEIKKNTNKKTNLNMKYKNMRTYILAQENGKDLIKEFERQIKLSQIQTSPYRAVLAWFKQTFEGYDSYKEYFEDLKKSKEMQEAA